MTIEKGSTQARTRTRLETSLNLMKNVFPSVTIEKCLSLFNWNVLPCAKSSYLQMIRQTSPTFQLCRSSLKNVQTYIHFKIRMFLPMYSHQMSTVTTFIV